MLVAEARSCLALRVRTRWLAGAVSSSGGLRGAVGPADRALS